MYRFKPTQLKQNSTDERKRLTVCPVICNDENFDFPLQIISKETEWSSPHQDETIDLDEVEISRKNFEKFKERYLGFRIFDRNFRPKLSVTRWSLVTFSSYIKIRKVVSWIDQFLQR